MDGCLVPAPGAKVFCHSSGRMILSSDRFVMICHDLLVMHSYAFHIDLSDAGASQRMHISCRMGAQNPFSEVGSSLDWITSSCQVFGSDLQPSPSAVVSWDPEQAQVSSINPMPRTRASRQLNWPSDAWILRSVACQSEAGPWHRLAVTGRGSTHD